MCVIINKVAGAVSRIEDADFRAAHSRNSDGVGIMYVEDGRIKVDRALGAVDNQKEVWDKVFDKEAWVMHFRFKTHGPADLDNCHPFKVLDIDEGDAVDLYMVHNGVISGYLEVDKAMSDTWNFVNGAIRPVLKTNPELIENEGFLHMIEKYVGSGNKLVFLRSDGQTFTVNEAAGSDFKGCWVSNTYSFNTPVQTTNHYGRSHGGYGGERNPGNAGWTNMYDGDDYYEAYYGKSEVNEMVDAITRRQKADDIVDGVADAITNKVMGNTLPIPSNVCNLPVPSSNAGKGTAVLPEEVEEMEVEHPMSVNELFEEPGNEPVAACHEDVLDAEEEAKDLYDMYDQQAVTAQDVQEFVYNETDNAVLLLAWLLNKKLEYIA